MSPEQVTLGETAAKTATKSKPKAKGGVIKVEPMSLEQFRSYLKGIMFVGGPTWRPDRDQWEAIVAIIDQLTHTVQQATPAVHQYQAPTWQSSPQPARFVQDMPKSALGGEDADGPYQTPFV